MTTANDGASSDAWAKRRAALGRRAGQLRCRATVGIMTEKFGRSDWGDENSRRMGPAIRIEFGRGSV